VALFLRTINNAAATAETISSCPISTPRLNAKSDHPSAARGRPNSFSTYAKPNP